MKAFAFCGSFCNHESALKQLEAIVAGGDEVLPVFSERVQSCATRFGTPSALIARAERVCGRRGVKSIAEAEKQITGADISCVVVAPCTGNTLARIALGITDGAVTMAVKAQLRNRRPVLIALASNDALSGSLKNIAVLLEKKNVYFVPLRQDAPEKKPASLVCAWEKLPEALAAAEKGRQLYPLIV